MRMTRFAAAALLLIALHGLALAAELPLSLVNLSSPVARSTDATIQVKTAPGATCAITVFYKSVASKAKGLDSKLADRSGLVEWRWRVGYNTTPGKWPIVMTCEQAGSRGELTTLLEVR